MKKRIYKTEGRERLLSFLREHPDCQFTADEVCLAVKGESGGKSSIYRQLDELCRVDAVRKFRDGQSRGYVYQYEETDCNCKNHFHAKCMLCGKLEHLDCSDSVDFAGHLMKEHGFSVDCGRSILWGICGDCQKERHI